MPTKTKAKKTRGNGGKGTIVDAQRVGGDYQMAPESLTVIGVDTTHTHRNRDKPGGHPYFDEKALLPRRPKAVQFAYRYKVTGILTVEKDGDRTIVIDGRQRTLDQRAANLLRVKDGLPPRKVKVQFERGDTRDLQRIMQASNALVVEEDPVTVARKIQDFVNDYGDVDETWEELSVTHGCTRAHLKDKLKLLDVDEKVLSHVSSGKLTATAATKLARLPREEQRQKVDELLSKPENVAGNGRLKIAAVKKAAGRHVTERPSVAKIKKVAEAASQVMNDRTRATLRWTIGEITDQEFAELVPGVTLEMM